MREIALAFTLYGLSKLCWQSALWYYDIDLPCGHVVNLYPSCTVSLAGWMIMFSQFVAFQVIGDGISLPIDANLVIEDLLPSIVKSVPLIMKDRDVQHFPFCVTSESEFLEWNVGKQRASEVIALLPIIYRYADMFYFMVFEFHM